MAHPFWNHPPPAKQRWWPEQTQWQANIGITIKIQILVGPMRKIAQRVCHASKYNELSSSNPLMT